MLYKSRLRWSAVLFFIRMRQWRNVVLWWSLWHFGMSVARLGYRANCHGRLCYTRCCVDLRYIRMLSTLACFTRYDMLANQRWQGEESWLFYLDARKPRPHYCKHAECWNRGRVKRVPESRGLLTGLKLRNKNTCNLSKSRGQRRKMMWWYRTILSYQR